MARGIIELGELEVKRLVFFVTLAIIVAGLLLFVLRDTVISVADTSIPDNEVSSTVSNTDNSGSVWDWGIYVALGALIVSIASGVWNYRHSESLFHRREYPAVLWHKPVASKKGVDTTLTTSMCNEGPREITSIFLGLFLCRGFKKEAWCKSECLEIKIGEPLDFVITQELERDIKERFGGLFYKDGWQFDGNPKRYKAIAILKYLPLISGVEPFGRKEYYLLTPVMESGKIKSWELKRIPNWQGRLPWF